MFNNMKEINERKLELRGLLESDKEINLSEIQAELVKLDEATKAIEERSALAKALNKKIEHVEERKQVSQTREQILATEEYRSAFFNKLLGRELSESEKRSATGVAMTNAAAAIPTQTANMLFDKMVKIAPMLNEIELLRVAGNVNFTVENARADAALHSETYAITPDIDTFTTVSLAGFEINKIVRISKSVQTMTIAAFEGWLVNMLAEDIAEVIENYIINGTGSSQPKGINYATTYTDASNAVEYTTTPTYSEIVELIGYLPARYDRNAKFLCNKKFLYQHLANVLDANGNPILLRDMVNGLGMKLLGYDILVSDKVTDGYLYLGDYKKVVGNLAQDITVDSSEASGFVYNSIDFRGGAIFDCDIALTDAFVRMKSA